MNKKIKKVLKQPRVKGFFLGLLYTSILIIPALIPFLLLSFYDSDSQKSGEDFRVEITRDALEEDFDQFAPRKIFKIGMYISDIYDIDIRSRSFGARFIYWGKNFFDKSKNDRSRIEDNPFKLLNAGLLYENQRAKRFIKGADEAENFMSYFSYEVRGSLKNEFYLANYPFDRHKLSFIFEPKNLTAQDILLLVDPNSILAGNFSFGEWDVKSFKASSQVQAAKSDFSDPALIDSGALWTYVPRVVFEIEIERQLLSHFLKELLPLFIVLIMAYTNLYVRPSEFESRSKAAFTAFLTIAALHWAASGMETGVSYLTAMDQFFLTGYALVFFLIVESVFSRTLCDEVHEQENLKIHPWFIYGMPIMRVLYLLMLIGGWYWIIVNAMQ